VFEGASRGNILEDDGVEGGVIIRAVVPLGAVLTAFPRLVSIRDITFDGNAKADYGILGMKPKGVIERTNVYRANEAGIKLGGNKDGSAFSWRILNCAISYNCRDGIQLGEVDSHREPTVHTDTHISFCTIGGNNRHGIWVGGGSPVIIIEKLQS
jgi:hypothetical protein